MPARGAIYRKKVVVIFNYSDFIFIRIVNINNANKIEGYLNGAGDNLVFDG